MLALNLPGVYTAPIVEKAELDNEMTPCTSGYLRAACPQSDVNTAMQI